MGRSFPFERPKLSAPFIPAKKLLEPSLGNASTERREWVIAEFKRTSRRSILDDAECPIGVIRNRVRPHLRPTAFRLSCETGHSVGAYTQTAKRAYRSS